MDEPTSQAEKPEDERSYDPDLLKQGLRCDLAQYDMLKRCSDKKDMTEWNEWRKRHSNTVIWLQGANLRDAYLKGAYLANAHLKGAELWCSHLEKAILHDADLEGADLTSAHLEGASLQNTYLRKAKLVEAHLEGSDLRWSHLEGADLKEAHLEGAAFEGASMKEAHLLGAGVDSKTNMWKVEVSQFTISIAGDWLYTDFSGVPLQNVIIDAPTKQLIEYNIRRKYWYKWITQEDWGGIAHRGNKPRNICSKIARYSTHLFFWFSDYGISTTRIIITFLGLALFFAVVYSNLACWFPPGAVSNLQVEPHLPSWHYGLLVFLRPIYFSVVTMTTLGFGDMYANAQSIWGHILLTIQVILGYVLLGALITRFAVLFTAGGPAGKFADEKKDEDEEQ
ncbi:MAG: pentapeptide repeat-containing protein [Planctomycetota bacterium]|nr:pentapeptide repeat-containing protein [Planctomycetota bacterium]